MYFKHHPTGAAARITADISSVSARTTRWRWWHPHSWTGSEFEVRGGISTDYETYTGRGMGRKWNYRGQLSKSQRPSMSVFSTGAQGKLAPVSKGGNTWPKS